MLYNIRGPVFWAGKELKWIVLKHGTRRYWKTTIIFMSNGLRTDFPNTELRIQYLESIIRFLRAALEPFAAKEECADGFLIGQDYDDHFCAEFENVRRARRILELCSKQIK